MSLYITSRMWKCRKLGLKNYNPVANLHKDLNTCLSLDLQPFLYLHRTYNPTVWERSDFSGDVYLIRICCSSVLEWDGRVCLKSLYLAAYSEIPSRHLLCNQFHYIVQNSSYRITLLNTFLYLVGNRNIVCLNKLSSICICINYYLTCIS